MENNLTTMPLNDEDEASFSEIRRLKQEEEEQYRADVEKEIATVLGDGFKHGQEVVISKKNGDIESDWKLERISGGNVVASKRNEEGILMSYAIKPADFLALNKREPEDAVLPKSERAPYQYEVKEGDDIYQIVRDKLIKDRFMDGSEAPEIEFYIVGHVLNEIRKNVFTNLQQVGIRSGNPELLYSGDVIDLDDLIEIGGGLAGVAEVVGKSKKLPEELVRILKTLREDWDRSFHTKKNESVPSEVHTSPDINMENNVPKRWLEADEDIRKVLGDNFKYDQAVSVVRSGGKKDPNWFLDHIQDGKVVVVSDRVRNEATLSKGVGVKEFLDLNSAISQESSTDKKDIPTVEENIQTAEIPQPISSGEQEAKDFGMQEDLDKLAWRALEEEILSIFFKKSPLVGGAKDYREEWKRLRNQDMEKISEFGAKYEKEAGNSPYITPERDRLLLLWKLIEQKRTESGVKPFLTESVESYLMRATKEILARRLHPNRQ